MLDLWIWCFCWEGCEEGRDLGGVWKVRDLWRNCCQALGCTRSECTQSLHVFWITFEAGEIRRLKSEASSFVVPAVERRVMEVIAQRAAATGAVAMLQGGGASCSHECYRSSKSIASSALTR